MKLGLSLAGGGIKGAAHIGALKVFEEENIKFDYVSGTSSGSIVSTLYAIGYSADEMLELFKKYGKKIKYVDLRNILKFVYGLLTKRQILINGFNSGIWIEKFINRVCLEKGIENINQINMPLIIPSVDLHTGALYVFHSNHNLVRGYSDKLIYINNINIGKAVRASCSYPGIFSPMKYNNTELIDGGLRENVPWKLAKDEGADKVISIVFKNNLKKECCSNVFDVVSNSLGILCHELSNYELQGADYLLKIRTKHVSLLDVKAIDMLYKEGYNQAKYQIKQIKGIINC